MYLFFVYIAATPAISFLKFMDEQVKRYLDSLPEDLQGGFVQSADVMLHPKEDDIKIFLKSKSSVKLLNTSNEDEAYTIVSGLNKASRRYVPNYADGDSLFRAVLACMLVPADFEADLLRKQCGVFAMRSTNFFRGKLDLGNETFKSYIRNLVFGHAFGDRNALKIIARMWSVCITVINRFGEEERIWHDRSL